MMMLLAVEHVNYALGAQRKEQLTLSLHQGEEGYPGRRAPSNQTFKNEGSVGEGIAEQ